MNLEATLQDELQQIDESMRRSAPAESLEELIERKRREQGIENCHRPVDLQAVISKRTKFTVVSVTRRHGSSPAISGGCEISEVRLRNVSGGSDENEAYWRELPHGDLVFCFEGRQAADGFDLGQEFFVDLAPAL